jgi:hypothetical protein
VCLPRIIAHKTFGPLDAVESRVKEGEKLYIK